MNQKMKAELEVHKYDKSFAKILKLLPLWADIEDNVEVNKSQVVRATSDHFTQKLKDRNDTKPQPER